MKKYSHEVELIWQYKDYVLSNHPKKEVRKFLIELRNLINDWLRDN